MVWKFINEGSCWYWMFVGIQWSVDSGDPMKFWFYLQFDCLWFKGSVCVLFTAGLNVQCLLHIHATCSSPDWFSLCLLMILYPSPVVLASFSCSLWSVLIQVSVMKNILMSFRVIWQKRASSLDLIDCIFISSILMRLWFHFVTMHLSSGQITCWWILLFQYHLLALFLPLLLPPSFLFNPNSLIFCRFLSSN